MTQADGNRSLPTLKEARDQAIADVESRYLKELYLVSGGNGSKACRLAGIKRTRLWELFKKYDIGLASSGP